MQFTIDRLLWCDYNFFVVDNNQIILIKKNEYNLSLDSEKITFTKSKKYPKLHYNNLSIAEISYYRPTPNIRLNIKNINNFLNDNSFVVKSKRWNYGAVTEKAICNIFNLENDIRINDSDLIMRITPYISRAFNREGIIPDEYVGKLTSETKIRNKIKNKGGDQILEELISGFGKSLHSPMDFYYKNRSISVKTNKKEGGLICPDTIGQPSSEKRCSEMFNILFGNKIEISTDSFVDFIMDCNNLKQLIIFYVKYLFA